MTNATVLYNKIIDSAQWMYWTNTAAITTTTNSPGTQWEIRDMAPKSPPKPHNMAWLDQRVEELRVKL